MKGGSREVKGHKSTGGGRTWYGKRKTLVPLSPSTPPPFLGVTKKKLSSFYSQRITCIAQESEARNRNTSIRSQIILEFWNIWSLNLSFFGLAGDKEFNRIGTLIKCASNLFYFKTSHLVHFAYLALWIIYTYSSNSESIRFEPWQHQLFICLFFSCFFF